MAKFTDSISTVNSLMRTLLAGVVLGGVAIASWVGYSAFTSGDRHQALLEETQAKLAAKDRLLQEKEQEVVRMGQQITDLNEEVALQQEQIEKLDTALRLLKVDHRIARLKVVDQMNDPQTGELFSIVEFVELNEEGVPIDEPRQFRIRGDLVYIDNWIVKFDDKYIEEADLHRSTSLVLFRRIFGEAQNPKDGYVLDTIGTRPSAYGRGTPMSDFEKKIWDDFWNIANNESRARELGIRAAHGEAPSIKVEKGKTYRVDLRASDGLSIRVE